MARVRVSAAAHTAARASFIALGFSIPISTAVDSILVGVIVLSWLLAARFRETADTVRTNPVAAIACLWFVIHAVGAIYSTAESRDITRSLGNASAFLLIPVAATMLRNPRDREWALHALMWAIGLTTVLSTLRWVGVIPADAPLLKDTGVSATVVFKYHLTQNLLVAFGALLFAIHAQQARTARLQWAWGAASALAIVNVFMMGDGRIGQVVLLVLMIYFAARLPRTSTALAAVALTAFAAAAAYILPDTALHKRTSLAVAEALQWNAGIPPAKPSSIGERFDYYRTSAAIVAQHPFLGVGTGGFAAAYMEQVRGTDLKPSRNPHNEYLLQAVELGAAGVLLLCGVFWTIWHHATRLATPTETLIARALVITFVCASFASSPFADHVEALLFVWATGVLFAGYRPALEGSARAGSVAPQRPGTGRES